MAIFPFRRRIRLDSLRGPARPSRPSDLEAHRGRRQRVAHAEYPGVPPGIDVARPGRKFFPQVKPDQDHLWFDRDFQVVFRQTDAGPFNPGSYVAASFDLSPPANYRGVVHDVGWAGDGYQIQSNGRMGLLLNTAAWRDYLLDMAGAGIHSITDPNETGVNPVVFQTTRSGLADDDLSAVYIDLAPQDTLTMQIRCTNDALGERIHGRMRGFFYI